MYRQLQLNKATTKDLIEIYYIEKMDEQVWEVHRYNRMYGIATLHVHVHVCTSTSGRIQRRCSETAMSDSTTGTK